MRTLLPQTKIIQRKKIWILLFFLFTLSACQDREAREAAIREAYENMLETQADSLNNKWQRDFNDLERSKLNAIDSLESLTKKLDSLENQIVYQVNVNNQIRLERDKSDKIRREQALEITKLRASIKILNAEKDVFTNKLGELQAEIYRLKELDNVNVYNELKAKFDTLEQRYNQVKVQLKNYPAYVPNTVKLFYKMKDSPNTIIIKEIGKNPLDKMSVLFLQFSSIRLMTLIDNPNGLTLYIKNNQKREEIQALENDDKPNDALFIYSLSPPDLLKVGDYEFGIVIQNEEDIPLGRINISPDNLINFYPAG